MRPKHLKNALHLDTCNFLTDLLHKSSGKGITDNQCPKSLSFRDFDELDRGLETFLPSMEEHVGKKLFPTYAYARLYKKGEILKPHTDREACEYSVTITLGFDDYLWPIFIAEQGEDTDSGVKGHEDDIVRVKNVQKLNLDVGEALLYKGNEYPHWREEFKGEWQAQIFLHYVDQEGPNVKEKFDKRGKLSHHEGAKHEEILYWYYTNSIAPTACDQMIEKFENLIFSKGQIGGQEENKTGNIDLSIRDVNKLDIPFDIGIGATLTGMGLNANKCAWNFDITHSSQSEYLRYDEKNHYTTHKDTFICPTQDFSRKITALAFLNDDFEGGKFYIQSCSDRIYPPQQKGTALFFPSFLLHGVEPVTKGTRRSIVTWLNGPWFK